MVYNLLKGFWVRVKNVEDYTKAEPSCIKCAKNFQLPRKMEYISLTISRDKLHNFNRFLIFLWSLMMGWKLKELITQKSLENKKKAFNNSMIAGGQLQYIYNLSSKFQRYGFKTVGDDYTKYVPSSTNVLKMTKFQSLEN